MLGRSARHATTESSSTESSSTESSSAESSSIESSSIESSSTESSSIESSSTEFSSTESSSTSPAPSLASYPSGIPDVSGSKSASARAFENYTGTVIAYEDLKIKEKIGHGGFGDVHVAQWKAAAVGSKPEKWNGNFELCLLIESFKPELIKIYSATFHFSTWYSAKSGRMLGG